MSRSLLPLEGHPDSRRSTDVAPTVRPGLRPPDRNAFVCACAGRAGAALTGYRSGPHTRLAQYGYARAGPIGSPIMRFGWSECEVSANTHGIRATGLPSE